MTFASSVAASAETPSRNRAITDPDPGHDRTGDPSAIGRTLPVEGRPHTIIGVMPAGFDPPRLGWLGEQELWLPFGPTDDNRAWGRSLGEAINPTGG